VASRALRYNPTEEDFPRQVAELLAYLEPAGPGQRLVAFPGEGTRVPVWLLGSSTYSAQLAAALGLPFAFASHFAPALLMDAAAAYRQQFRPSKYLERPYFAAGVPVVGADCDEEARFLATSALQRGLQLIRRQPIFVPPPVESMDALWSEGERYVVQSRMAVAVVGGPATVRLGMDRLLRETGADELVLVSDLYEHTRRLRSFEIAAEAMRGL